MKREVTDWKKKLANHILDKYLMSRTLKTQWQRNKQTTQKISKRYEETFHQSGDGDDR